MKPLYNILESILSGADLEGNVEQAMHDSIGQAFFNPAMGVEFKVKDDVISIKSKYGRVGPIKYDILKQHGINLIKADMESMQFNGIEGMDVESDNQISIYYAHDCKIKAKQFVGINSNVSSNLALKNAEIEAPRIQIFGDVQFIKSSVKCNICINRISTDSSKWTHGVAKLNKTKFGRIDRRKNEFIAEIPDIDKTTRAMYKIVVEDLVPGLDLKDCKCLFIGAYNGGWLFFRPEVQSKISSVLNYRFMPTKGPWVATLITGPKTLAIINSKL